MTCEMMLERILDAEPAELEGRGGTLVARHVRACAKCAAVARQLGADSAGLAAELSDKSSRAGARVLTLPLRVRHRSYLAPASVSAVLVAAAAVFMLLRSGDVSDVGTDVAPRRVADVAELARTRAEPDQPSQSDGARAAPSRTPARERRVLALRFDREVPVTAVRISATAVPSAAIVDAAPRAALDTAPQVVVTPPPGVRATVMQGSAPGVTIVWLH